MGAGRPPHRKPRTRSLAVAAIVASAVGLCGVAASALLVRRAASAEAADEGAAAGRARAGAITIAWAGDTTLGSQYGLPPRRGWEVLRHVAPALRDADLTALNYEGTLATSGASKCAAVAGPECFAFRAPPENAAALRRAGVDVASLANNHAFDYGAVAMGETVRALRRQRIAVTGRPGEVLLRRVRGVRVAMLGFSSHHWTNPIADLALARRRIRDAARRADVVVAFMHAGAEGADRTHTPAGAETYLGEARGDVRAFARAAIDAGADLVLGSGPHVLRGIERRRGRLIAYSLGNLGGFRNFATGGVLSLSAVLRVEVTARGRFREATIAPLALDASGIPHPDPGRRAERLIATLSREDFGRRGIRVADRIEPLSR